MRHRSEAVRGGFTAIEMIVVLGVIVILLGLAMPAVLSATRRAAVQDGARIIQDSWRVARDLAMTTHPPSGNAPNHFGVAVAFTDGRIQASVIFDNRATLASGDLPSALLRAATVQTGGGVSRKDASAQPSYAKTGPANAVLVADSGSGAPTVPSSVLLWYAQYRTGAPIIGASVAAGAGAMASPIGIGIPGSPIAARLLSATPDYDPSARTGYASAVRVFHVGVSSVDAP